MSLTQAVLLLKDGTFFKGNALGKIGTTTGEICFNTGMTGYQEVFHRSFLLWSNTSSNQCSHRKLWG
jgi:hypothetical protein